MGISSIWLDLEKDFMSCADWTVHWSGFVPGGVAVALSEHLPRTKHVRIQGIYTYTYYI